MGKTRDLFRKIGDIKGAFHSRMVTIKDRMGKDRTEAEEIKNRCQEYTEGGEEPRWRRSRTGRTLSPPQIHQKSI